jgi:hypothetical protein
VPRFFFDIRQDGVTKLDTDGLVLPSVSVARAEAARAAIDMVKEAMPHHSPGLIIAVRDQNGKHLFEVEVLVNVRERQ